MAGPSAAPEHEHRHRCRSCSSPHCALFRPRPAGLYPGTEKGVSSLPEDVAGYYRDAIIVLQAGVPGAAAVQLRRTLEAAATHFGVNVSPLSRAIKALIEKGLVTAQFGEVLGHIRQLGNLGAHASDERVDQEGAERALRFTTAVLRDLFEIPAELAALGQAPPGDDTT